jgi:hypothetical protein
MVHPGALAGKGASLLAGLATERARIAWEKSREKKKLIQGLADAVRADADVDHRVRSELAKALPDKIGVEPDVHVALGYLLQGERVKAAQDALAEVVARIMGNAVPWPTGFTPEDFGKIVASHAPDVINKVLATDRGAAHTDAKSMLDELRGLADALEEAGIARRPLDRVEVLANWGNYERTKRAAIAQRLRRRTSAIPPPELGAVQNLLEAIPWHERIGDAIDDLSRASGPEPLSAMTCPPEITAPIVTAVRDLRDVSLEQTYAVIAEDVVEILAGALTPARRLLSCSRGRAARDAAQGLSTAVERLSALTSEPRYERCLPVVGRLGAGKTHLIVRLLTPEKRSLRTVFVLAPDVSTAQGGVLRMLIREAEEATGRAWRTLADLDAFVRNEHGSLLAIVDDLHRWRSDAGFRVDLISSITKTTHLRSLRWLVTTDTTRLDDTLQDRDFWTLYGIRDHGDPAWPESSDRALRTSRSVAVGAGWLNVDVLNTRDETGWRVYVDVAGMPNVEPEPDFKAKLFKPDVAWMAIDLRSGHQLSDLLSLNSIELVEEYWRDVPIDELGVTARELEEASLLVGDVVLDSQDGTLTREKLLTQLHKRAEDHAMLDHGVRAAAALDGLRTLGAISYHLDEERQSERVVLELEAYWWWRVAQRLAARTDLFGGSPEALAGALAASADAISRPDLIEGVLQFLVLVADRREHDRKTAEKICRDMLNSASLPSASVWLAGPDASAGLQAALGRLASTPRNRDRRETFALMYFLIEGVHAFSRPAQRLELLCAPFARIVKFGLEAYLYSGAAHWLEQTPLESFAGALHAMRTLRGPSQSGADRVAEMARDILLERANSDLDLARITLYAYLRAESKTPPERRQADSRTFRQWLILRYCEAVFAKHGSEAFEWLARIDWYQRQGRQIAPIVRGDMKVIADLAAGYWYRRDADPAGRADYERLVLKLARSSKPKDRCHAFELLRLSAPTAGRNDVPIDPELHLALTELWNQPGARKAIPELRQLYCANLPNDPACGGPQNMRR